MIPAFLLGTAVGLGIGWKLGKKWYAGELRLVTEERLRLTDLLAETSSLNTQYRAMLQEQTETRSVETSAKLIAMKN